MKFCIQQKCFKRDLLLSAHTQERRNVHKDTNPLSQYSVLYGSNCHHLRKGRYNPAITKIHLQTNTNEAHIHKLLEGN